MPPKPYSSSNPARRPARAARPALRPSTPCSQLVPIPPLLILPLPHSHLLPSLPLCRCPTPRTDLTHPSIPSALFFPATCWLPLPLPPSSSAPRIPSSFPPFFLRRLAVRVSQAPPEQLIVVAALSPPLPSVHPCTAIWPGCPPAYQHSPKVHPLR